MPGPTGNHVIILSIPMHKGKTVKKGQLVAQIKKAGLTVEEFLKCYK